ncbi:hypothetical protein ACU686_15370 [Yinghuangia aomiensis]
MASHPFDWLDTGDGWHAVAESLRRLGCRWPILAELSAAGGPQPDAESDVVARIAAQARDEMGGLPTLPFWDTACGLVARSWRLGTGDALDALYNLDALWYTARDFDTSAAKGTGLGLQLIGEGVAFKESSAYVDITQGATTLLTEADRLIPSDVRDARLCEALLETFR